MPEDEKPDKYKRQAKYHEKTGTKPFMFRLKESVVSDFKATCKQRKQSYAGILTALMRHYIESPEKYEKENEPPTAQ